jgi:hypothetical protein
MEKCWSIKEKLPISVKVLPNNDIQVAPMLMSYETFEKLGDNLSEEEIKYRLEREKSHGLGDLTDKMIKYPTGVYGFIYNYDDGSCLFISRSKNDTKNWLKLYEDYVKVIV